MLEHRINQLFLNILHCSIPSNDFVAAAELTAITTHKLKKNPNDISVEEIVEQWMRADSHQRLETHLPALIPLDYIDHIYMPRTVFECLSPSVQATTVQMFGSWLIITSHEVPRDNCISVKIDNVPATCQNVC